MACFLVAVRGDDRNADHGVRLWPSGRRLKVVAVNLERLVQQSRREVCGEREGQAEEGGELGAEGAGAEQPDRDVRVGTRDGLHPLCRIRSS